MKKFLLVPLLWAAASSASAQTTTATTVRVTGKGSTFVWKFPANGGFTTNRGDTLESAAQFWADRLESPVDIEIAVSFQSLGCTPGGGVLGSAGPRSVHLNFSGAPRTNTLYPAALANSYAGTDLNTPAQSSFPEDIVVTLNSDPDDPNEAACFNGGDWHYGTSPPSGSDISLYQVTLHELAHGLGFASFADFTTGELAGLLSPSLSGTEDHYVIFLRDAANNRDLDAASATDAQRQSAGTSGDLVWNGADVNAAASTLTAGTNQSQVEMFAPSTFRSGSSISHFDTSLAPDQLMEPSLTGSYQTDLTEELLYEVGWLEANETPIITGQSPLSVDEDDSISLALTDLTVTDADNSYPADFTLSVLPGNNYSVSGTTVTPDPDFDLPLTVPVVVNDGIQDSAAFDLSITVNPINDPPLITAQQILQSDEDTPITLSTDDLVIDDPDDTSFALSVQSGANYSVAGTTVTPDPDFNGTITVPVTVDDGDVLSPSFDVVIEVSPVNDPPTISAQGMLSVPEDTPFTFALGDVSFSDPDTGAGFSLRVLAGSNYSFSGTTVTPAPNFSGSLTVPVVVNDGEDDSPVFDTTLLVTPVNDAPSIAQQAPLATSEDTPIAVSLSDLTIIDPDDTRFTLTLSMVMNGTAAGNVITPDPDFFGTITAMAVVSDGQLSSPPFALTIEVSPVNDPPIVTAALALETDEDTPLTISPSDLTIEDPDSGSFTVQIAPGIDYTASGDTLSPSADFSGTLQVELRVDDGQISSPPFTTPVIVRAINDPPVVTGQSAITIQEDVQRLITIADLTVEDVDDDPGSLSVVLLAGSDYGFSGAELSPAPDFSGPLQVNLQVSDGTDSSEPFVLDVTVEPVDDAPVISGQDVLTATEDQPFTLSLDDIAFDDADGEGDFSLVIEAGSDYSAAGLEVTPAPDFFGPLDVQVRVDDGALTSELFALRVEVEPVNDPPVIVSQGIISTFRDTPIAIELLDLVVEDVDDVFPDDFNLSLSSPISGTLSELSFTPAPSFTGLAEVTAVVNDGEADSDPFTLVVGVAEPTIAARIEIEAVGLFTPLPELEAPDALGLVPDGEVTLAEGPALLRPGRQTIVWREANEAGDEAFFEQEIDVRPLVDFALAPVVQADEEGRLDVWLNGFSPSELELAFSVEDEAGVTDLMDGVARFDTSSLLSRLPFQTFAGGGGTSIVRVQADFGAAEIPVLQGSNSPPRVELDVEQDGRPGLVIIADGGPVRFTARAFDAESNPTVVWRFPPDASVSEEGPARLVDPSTLQSGDVVTARVTDDGGASAIRRLALRVLPNLPPVPSVDLDGDGEANESEAEDADGDGLADAFDAWALPHVMPIGLDSTEGELSPDVLEAEPGPRLTLGSVVQGAGGLGAGLSPDQLEAGGPADELEGVDAYVDLIITDLARTGQEVALVIPLRAALPSDPVVLRAFQSSAWFDFVGGLASAPGGPETCPPPDATDYEPGLSPGDRCMRLVVRDGGGDDGDGAANREIVLLTGLARPSPNEPAGGGVDQDPGDDPGQIASEASGECSCRETQPASGAPWSLLALLGLGLAARRRLSVARARR